MKVARARQRNHEEAGSEYVCKRGDKLTPLQKRKVEQGREEACRKRENRG